MIVCSLYGCCVHMGERECMCVWLSEPGISLAAGCSVKCVVGGAAECPPPRSATEPQEAGGGERWARRWFCSLQLCQQAVAITLIALGSASVPLTSSQNKIYVQYWMIMWLQYCFPRQSRPPRTPYVIVLGRLLNAVWKPHMKITWTYLIEDVAEGSFHLMLYITLWQIKKCEQDDGNIKITQTPRDPEKDKNSEGKLESKYGWNELYLLHIMTTG